jgi:hypothetical protein
MAKSSPPTIIKAFKDKAQVVRDIARKMNLDFTESEIAGRPDLVRFEFDIDFADAQGFLSALPIEIFAYRATMGS